MNESNELESLEKELGPVLKQFRTTVHSWSAQEYARVSVVPVGAPSPRRIVALRWAFAVCCLMIAASVPVHRERVRQEQQIQAAFQTAEDAQLLKDIDEDVSRTVPSSMSPLTYLIAAENPEQGKISGRSPRQGETQP